MSRFAVHLRGTLAAIAASLAGLVALASWDEQREAREALDDFAADQAQVARSLASHLEVRLRDLCQRSAACEGADTRELRWADESRQLILVAPQGEGAADFALPFGDAVLGLARFVRPGTEALVVVPPTSVTTYTASGTPIRVDAVRPALRAGLSSALLSREQARTLGLPERAAVVGLGVADGGELGHWGLGLVVSAERLREREDRARGRLLLTVVTSGCLVLGFGLLALRRQRRELQLHHELAVSAVERQHERRLDAASRAATLGTLAMGIAHEIATPASVIHGRAGQLLSRVGEPRNVEALRAIVEQAERISAVVSGFLHLARGDAAPSGEVHVAAVVDGALGLVEHRFAKAGVAVEADVPSEARAVLGDARLLEHALVNLLLNACDACEPGGSVSVAVHEDDRGVCLRVEDDGCGISPEHVSQVTRPFFTTKSVGKGTGLGLAISSEIVRAHRGALRLEARAPRGTVATIHLPFAGPAR